MIETIAGRTRSDRSGAGQGQSGQPGTADAVGTTPVSAEIIAFRPRPAAEAPAGAGSRTGSRAGFRSPGRPASLIPPQTQGATAATPAQQRLARAVTSLNTAMEDQRAAMTQWRTALAALKTTAAALGNSMELYRTNLASLSEGVSSLHTEANALHLLADKLPIAE
jgi:hypothetical protein